MWMREAGEWRDSRLGFSWDAGSWDLRFFSRCGVRLLPSRLCGRERKFIFAVYKSRNCGLRISGQRKRGKKKGKKKRMKESVIKYSSNEHASPK